MRYIDVPTFLKAIEDNLNELNLSLVDTPCTTDKESNFVSATLNSY